MDPLKADFTPEHTPTERPKEGPDQGKATEIAKKALTASKDGEGTDSPKSVSRSLTPEAQQTANKAGDVAPFVSKGSQEILDFAKILLNEEEGKEPFPENLAMNLAGAKQILSSSQIHGTDKATALINFINTDPENEGLKLSEDEKKTLLGMCFALMSALPEDSGITENFSKEFFKTIMPRGDSPQVKHIRQELLPTIEENAKNFNVTINSNALATLEEEGLIPSSIAPSKEEKLAVIVMGAKKILAHEDVNIIKPALISFFKEQTQGLSKEDKANIRVQCFLHACSASINGAPNPHLDKEFFKDLIPKDEDSKRRILSGMKGVERHAREEGKEVNSNALAALEDEKTFTSKSSTSSLKSSTLKTSFKASEADIQTTDYILRAVASKEGGEAAIPKIDRSLTAAEENLGKENANFIRMLCFIHAGVHTQYPISEEVLKKFIPVDEKSKNTLKETLLMPDEGKPTIASELTPQAIHALKEAGITLPEQK